MVMLWILNIVAGKEVVFVSFGLKSNPKLKMVIPHTMDLYL